MQNAPREHSAILLTCIKQLSIFNTFVFPISKWPLKTGLTVHQKGWNHTLTNSFSRRSLTEKQRFHNHYPLSGANDWVNTGSPGKYTLEGLGHIVAAYDKRLSTDKNTYWLFEYTHGWKFKITKILNFRNSNFKTCRMPTKMINFKFEWLIVLRSSENIREVIKICLIQHCEADF